MANKTNPLGILSKEGCKVQSLTVSDQHATLLLSHTVKVDTTEDTSDTTNDERSDDEYKTVQSLLKLTVIPFHKPLLGSNPVFSSADIENGQPPERNMLQHDAKASTDILVFLSKYKFKLKSESGAEYSYYTANPGDIRSTTSDAAANNDSTSTTTEDNFLQFAISNFGSFDVELISPASASQIARAMPIMGHTLVHETPAMYETIVKPHIQIIVDSGSLDWIINVIELKKETERLLVDNEQFVINVDTKWRSHPSPLNVPRKEWLNHPSVEDLYCLAITKLKGIASLRDLRSEHIPMLKAMNEEGLRAIKTIYGVESDQIRVFVHYQPQFYHFHVHFTRLQNEVGSSCERGHLLFDVLQNLEMDDEYYSKRTIVYKLKRGTPIHILVEDYLNNAKE
eukprot:g1946.t1 g1946   contig11:406548-407738(+)